MKRIDVDKVRAERDLDVWSSHIERIVDRAPVHNGMTFAELDGVFNSVKDRDDWKAPIDVLVLLRHASAVASAIEFFTATEPKIETTECLGVLRITSEGYRNGPAGP